MARPTRRQQIPAISRSQDLSRFSAAVKQTVESLIGAHDPLDRAVTLRELQDGTLTVRLRSVTAERADTPAPGSDDDVVVVEPPTVPTGLEASGGFNNVVLRWDPPGFSGYAHTEIWRAQVDDFGQAVRVDVGVRPYPDLNVSDDTTYYYWVRHVNIRGDVGPLNATAGTPATTAVNSDYIIGEISGAIARSDLAQALRDTIDLIDAPDTGLLDRIDAQLVNEFPNGDFEAALDTHLLRPVVSAQAHSGSQSLHAGGAGMARFDDVWRHDPAAGMPALTPGSDWTLVLWVWSDEPTAVDFGYAGGGGFGRFTVQDTGGSWELRQVNFTVPTGVGDPAVLELRTAVAWSGNIYFDDVMLLRGHVTSDGAYRRGPGGVEYNALALQGLDSRVTDTEDEISSQASAITSLESRVGDAETDIGANASAISGLDTRVTDAEGQISANANAITELAVSSGQGTFDPHPEALWEFEGGNDGWTASDATLTPASFYTRLALTAAGGHVEIGGLSVDGGRYTAVAMRIRRNAGTSWTGRVYYSTGSHGFTTGFYKEVAKPTDFDTGDWQIVSFDMEALDAGGTDWLDSTVTGLRLELVADSGDAVDIDWVAVAKYSPPASSSAVNALSSRLTTAEGEIDANSTALTALDSRVGDAEADIGANATALSQLDTRVTDAEGEISAHSSQIDSLTSAIDDAEGGIDANASAIGVLETRVTQTEDDVSAQADAITQLSTTVDGNTATVQQHAQSLNGLEAQYTVKLDVNGAVAGFGLATTPSDDTSDGQFSEFYVNADRFAVLPQGGDPGSAAVAPFVVQDNQVLLNEVIANRITVGDAMVEELNAAKLFAVEGTLAEALIGEAEITSAMIGQAVINEGHIGEAVINSAHIGQAEVDTLHIRGEAVTVSNHFVSTGTVDLSTSSGFTGWTAWTTVATLALNSEGNPTGIWFSAKLMFAALITNFNVNSGRARLEFRLRRGTTELQRFRWYDWVTDSRTNRETVMFSYRDASPPVGAHTYRVQARVYDSRDLFRVECEVSHRSMFNLGTKR